MLSTQLIIIVHYLVILFHQCSTTVSFNKKLTLIYSMTHNSPIWFAAIIHVLTKTLTLISKMPTLKNNLVLKNWAYIAWKKKVIYIWPLTYIGMAKAQAFKRRSWGRTDLGENRSGGMVLVVKRWLLTNRKWKTPAHLSQRNGDKNWSMDQSRWIIFAGSLLLLTSP